MKTHTSSYKTNIKEFGRELDSKITYTLNGVVVELGSEQLNSITPHYEGAILKSVMKQLDIDSNVEIPIGTILTYQFGVKVGNSYEYINYGNYVVKDVEKQEDTLSYKITCYDKMLYAMKDYENIGIRYPITIKDYLIEICTKIGLIYEGSQFANSSKILSNELYLDADGNSLNYTFRDVLDEIAQVSGGTICINNDDELEVRYVHDVGDLQTATGSSLTLSSEEAELQNFELEGKTTQETRSGKNLFHLRNGTYTINGITAIVINGEITLNGTATANAFVGIPVDTNLNWVSGQKYTISAFNETIDNNVRIRINSSGSLDTRIDSINKKYTFTYDGSEGMMTTQISIRVQSSATLTNFKLKPQLELGNGTSTYEQYGASPSPDYPSELVSVGYKNLFDVNATPITTINTSTNLIEKGKRVTINYGSTYQFALFKLLDVSNYVGKTFSVKIDFQSSANNKGQYNIGLCDENGGNRISGRSTPNSGTLLSYTIPTITTSKYLAIWLYANTNGTANVGNYVDYTNIEVELGEDTHNYISYGKYGIEIKTTGKNLLLNNGVNSTTINGVTFTKNQDGSVTINGTATANANFPIFGNGWSDTSSIIRLENGTNYTLSKGTANAVVYIRDGINNINTETPLNGTRTFNNISNITYAFIQVANGRTASNEKIYPMIEKGSTATTYEEHKANTYSYILDEPLRGIGNYKDLLYIKNGMLYVDRKIGKFVLNGSENWTQFATATSINTILYGTNVIDNIPRVAYVGLSNYFKSSPSSIWSVDIEALTIAGIGTDTIRIRMNKNVVSGASAFKTWLSTHNTEVNYVLENSYTEELGTIEPIKTYDGTTYIDAPSTMNVSYITNFEEIDEEYLKDVNVNFGEKFGPVNTIVLSRGGDGDKISLSIPSDLADENKVAIQISDNQIMNGNNRDEYMSELLNKLYGLEYYINDFSSTGITYLELCDKYRVKVGETSYPCIMFNDETNITQGLEESVYTDMQEENEQEYKYMSSTDRGIKQANIIANKNEATISLYTEETDKLSDRVHAVELRQDTDGATIKVLGTNIDDNGNITAVRVKEGYTFDENGFQIYTDDNSFKTLINETGTYYYDGSTPVAEYTKDGSKQKDLHLFGVYYYGMNNITETPMFVAQKFIDYTNNPLGEEAMGHFYNKGN